MTEKGDIIKKILGFALIVFLWFVISQYTNPLFIPSPLKVFKSAIEMIQTKILLRALLYSFLRITVATTLSALIAVPLGLFMFNFKIINSTLSPITNSLRFIPITAFYPLLIMWFGIEEKMKIAFLFMATFVYMLPSVMFCLKEVNQDLLDTAMTVGMNKVQIIYKVLLPSSLPSILQSFITCYGIGWTYIAISETINAKYGLGFIINVNTLKTY